MRVKSKKQKDKNNWKISNIMCLRTVQLQRNKVNEALDINNDELIRVNNRIDSLSHQLGKSKDGDFDSFKDYLEIRLLEMDK